jgi:Holliday junction resolvasome RuvABC endonuclease subunit
LLIAIDASTVATGFVFGGPGDGAPRGGVWRLPGADEVVFDRTLSLAGESLQGLAQLVEAKHVAIEAPLHVIDRFHSAASASALIQLTGALRAAAHRAGCKVHLFAVSHARKHFIGTSHLNGDEAKAAVMARCKQLGWAFQDNNQADACAVWALAMACIYPKWAPQTGPLFAAAKAGGA